MAAGQGKRMCSSKPKVLNEVGGKSMLAHILMRVQEALPKAQISVVVGYGREVIEKAISSDPIFKDLKISFVTQAQQNGTGDAVRCAMDSDWGESLAASKQPILVLPGDLPLISTSLIEQMAEPLAPSQGLRLLTCDVSDPTGYGRIVRKGKKGSVLRIVEERDANVREKAISEVGASIYFFNSSFLKVGLKHMVNKNAQKEYYLTDLVAQAVRVRKQIDVLQWQSPEELRGVNNPWELAQAGQILNQTVLKSWALRGVRFVDPATTWVDTTVQLSPEVTIYPNASLSGTTHIGRGAVIGQGVVLKNMQVGENTVIKTGTVGEDSSVGAQANIGPYAHLRPGSVVGAECKIGNFVELKNTRVGKNTSIAHLSYLGDADVGAQVNIGCGFVTCNFDGRVIQGKRKHQTQIEDGAFIGSDCQTVAPVRVGQGAYIASGSTITENVEADSMAIARSRQINKPGYAKRFREPKSG